MPPARALGIGNRLIRDGQNPPRGQLFDQHFRIPIGDISRDVEFRANALRHDFGKGRAAVGRFPDHRRYVAQTEELRVYGRHDHHFAAQHARSDRLRTCDVFVAHRINSQARSSGVKTNRATGTRETNSIAASNTRFTKSGSCAKNRMLRIRACAASGSLVGTMRLSGPFSQKIKRLQAAPSNWFPRGPILPRKECHRHDSCSRSSECRKSRR